MIGLEFNATSMLNLLYLHKNIPMKWMYLSVILIVLEQSVPAQDKAFQTDNNYLEAYLFINPLVGVNQQYYNRWAKGTVELENGVQISDVFIAYNQYIDELLWLREYDFQIGVVYKKLVKSFTITTITGSSTKFVKTKLKDWYKFDTSVVYLQELVSGKVSLYAQRKLVKISSTSNEFDQKDRYFLKIDENYFSFKPRRSELFRILKSDKSQLLSIIRENHLRVRKENDLIKAISLYNQWISNKN